MKKIDILANYLGLEFYKKDMWDGSPNTMIGRKEWALRPSYDNVPTITEKVKAILDSIKKEVTANSAYQSSIRNVIIRKK
jgi:hypothetical protein